MVTVEGVSLRDVHRAARYMGEVGALLDDLRKASGDTARTARVKRDFHRRISRRAPIAGLPMLADIDALVALAAVVQATGTPIIFDSGRSRPGRRRR